MTLPPLCRERGALVLLGMGARVYAVVKGAASLAMPLSYRSS